MRLAVVGHTDNQRLSPRTRALYQDNQGLSEARALAVAEFLRRELGRRIHIHTLPELHFVYDDSIERGASLSLLINQASALSDQTPEE